MGKQKIKVAVVLPAYNEASVIEQVLKNLPRTLKVGGKYCELVIVVVNDGSKDATAVEAHKVKDVVVISHLINMGAGAATRTGLRYARQINADYAITMDADGQHDPEDAKRLLEASMVEGIDFAVGSRLIDTTGMPGYKIIGNKLLNIITLVLLGAYATDTQSGLKVLNSRALKTMEYHSNSYAFCSEMIWRAKQQNLKFAEIPIKAIYTDYSLSRGQSNLSGAMKIVGQMFKRRMLELFHE